MPRFEYHWLDVFTDQPFTGNQLAVFIDAADFPPNLMQTVAREMNLSETVFVLPAEGDDHAFHLRIFTPGAELPMAGHPTVGTAYALKRAGKIAGHSVRFLEGVGVIPVQYDGDVAWMTQPAPTFGDVRDDRDVLAAMLSLTADDLIPDLPVQAVSTGVPFLFVPIKDKATIRRAKLRADLWERALRDTAYPQVYLFTPETDHPDATAHSRMFAPSMGIVEDPATGAACGPLGAYLVQYGLAQAGTTIRNEQGVEMGRPSLIHIHVISLNDGIRVGGTSRFVGAGWIEI